MMRYQQRPHRYYYLLPDQPVASLGGGGVPANGLLDRAGNAIVDRTSSYVVTR